MRLQLFIFIFAVFCQCLYAEKYQNADNVEEPTTKKSGGFFGGVKNFFRGSPTTTTTIAPLLPAKTQIQAPLQPLGPRPETPDSTSASQSAFEWPALSNNAASSGSKQANLPPGFGSYSLNSKKQPSGVELSYGNHGPVGTSRHGSINPPQQRPPASSSTSTTTTTTTTTTSRSVDSSNLKIDMRSGADSVTSPKSPSAWNKPLRFDSDVTTSKNIVVSPSTPASGNSNDNKPLGNNGVSFVNTRSDSTTTARTGVESQTNSYASDDEIRALTEELYQKEVHSSLSYIQVQLQGRTRSIDSADEAPQPLLVVNEKAYENPAVLKMRDLFNNYEADTLVNEHVSALEKNEENAFIDSLMSTNVMKHTMQFLQKRGFVTADVKTHRDLLKELWFTQYSRGQGRIGSSGFEHVFVNEVKNGTIIGLHNWVYFNDEEKAGRLDYKGYIKALDLGTKAKVAKVRFTHNGLNKPVNTLFIGTSPEMEMALYTLCFELRPDRTCPVSLGNSKFGIVTYSWRYRGKNLIGSAYPEI